MPRTNSDFRLALPVSKLFSSGISIEEDISNASPACKRLVSLATRLTSSSSWITSSTSLSSSSSQSYVEADPAHNIDSLEARSKSLSLPSSLHSSILSSVPADELMQESDLAPKMGKKRLKKLRKEQREKTAGANWFHMHVAEDEEQIRDARLIQMRGAVASASDGAHFYKRGASANLPKYFQVGKVVDSAADFYSDRVPRKSRKATLVDELLADAEFRRQSRRKFAKIIEDSDNKPRRYVKKSKK